MKNPESDRFIAKSDSVRVCMVMLACATVAAWLWALFLFPDPWRDREGMNQLVAIILAGGLHLVVGFALLVAASFRRVRTQYATLVTASPIAYLLGASIDMPTCLVLFLGPALAILIASAFEVQEGRTWVLRTQAPTRMGSNHD